MINLLPVRNPVLSPVAKEYCQKFLIEGEIVRESTCQKVVRLVVYVGVFSVALTGTIPYANISLQLTGNNPGGYFLVLGNASSFTSLNVWSWLNFIHPLFITSSPQEIILREKKTCGSTCAQIAYVSASVGIGVFSQIALAYLTYKYNDGNIAYAVLTLSSDSGFPIYSLYLTFNRLFQDLGCSDLERKLQNIRRSLLHRLSVNLQAILNLPYASRQTLLSKFSALKKKDGEVYTSIKIQECLRLFFSPEVFLEVSTQSECESVARKGAQLLGLWFVVARLGFLTLISNQATTEVVDEDSPWNIMALGTVAGANAYLCGKIILHSIETVYDKFIRKQQNHTLASIVYPRLTKISRGVSLILGSLSWGPSFKATDDAIDDIGLKRLMEVSLSISTAILVSNAIYDLADTLLRTYAHHIQGRSRHRELIALDRKYRHFSRLIETMSFKAFASFLNGLPDDFLQPLLNNNDLSAADLMAYANPQEDLSLPLLSES